MTVYEDQCVSCPPEMGCLGNSCPNLNVEVHRCDECKDYADCIIDDEELCFQCAEKKLNNYFNELEISEKAKILGLKFFNIEKN